MKKKMLYVMIFSLVLLTGCGKTKLICKYSTSDSYQGDNEIRYKLTYDKKGNVDKVVVFTKSRYGDKFIENNNINMEEESKTAKQICEQYKDQKNVTCNANLVNNTITLELKYNYKKMSDEDKEKFGFGDSDSMKYDIVKSSYEKNGYTCK